MKFPLNARMHMYATSLCCLLSLTALTQVNLPYTLHFTTNSTSAWADGIAQDGDGGTANINGLDIQVYASNAAFTGVHPGATMVWHDNDYFSSGNADFTGITPGPDVPVTMDGVPAMVIKSTNPAINFSLTNVRMYDWGGYPNIRIATYNDGILIGSITVASDVVNNTTKTLTQASGLTPALFQNVDEIRFTPVGGTSFWLSLNDIGLATSIILPVNISSFNAVAKSNRSVALNWATQQEVNSKLFEIEYSRDGIQFTKAGEIAARGNSNTVSPYRFTTPVLPAGKYFFRLKQIDADGAATYSTTIPVVLSGKAVLQLYPNPVQDKLNIYSGGDMIREVKIYNAAGILVLTQKTNQANVSINLAQLPKAMYYADITTDKETMRQSILKQ